MEIGLVFAILVAIFFGASDIFIRRGMIKAGESYTAVFIGLLIGIILFPLMISFNAEWDKVWSLSSREIGLLVGAGVIHYIGGRFLYYAGVRLIGANKGSAISKTDILTAVVLGIVILNESLSSSLMLGVLFILPGVILVSIEKQVASAGGESKVPANQVKGIISCLGAGLFWGASGVLIKPAVGEIGSPFVGVFVSYIAAALIMAGLLFRREQREHLVKLNRSALIPIAIAGVLTSAANFFRYTALSYSPVSLVRPIESTYILYLLLFSFLFNRKIEVFTPKVIIGMLLVVAGTVILSS